MSDESYASPDVSNTGFSPDKAKQMLDNAAMYLYRDDTASARSSLRKARAALAAMGEAAGPAHWAAASLVALEICMRDADGEGLEAEAAMLAQQTVRSAYWLDMAAGRVRDLDDGQVPADRVARVLQVLSAEVPAAESAPGTKASAELADEPEPSAYDELDFDPFEGPPPAPPAPSAPAPQAPIPARGAAPPEKPAWRDGSDAPAAPSSPFAAFAAAAGVPELPSDDELEELGAPPAPQPEMSPDEPGWLRRARSASSQSPVQEQGRALDAVPAVEPQAKPSWLTQAQAQAGSWTPPAASHATPAPQPEPPAPDRAPVRSSTPEPFVPATPASPAATGLRGASWDSRPGSSAPVRHEPVVSPTPMREPEPMPNESFLYIPSDLDQQWQQRLQEIEDLPAPDDLPLIFPDDEDAPSAAPHDGRMRMSATSTDASALLRSFADHVARFKDDVSDEEAEGFYELGLGLLDMDVPEAMEAAAKLFDQAMRNATTRVPATEGYLKALVGLGDAQGAFGMAGLALSHYATSQDSLAGIYFLRARAAETIGDPAEAVRCYGEALRTDPYFSDAVEARERLRTLS